MGKYYAVANGRSKGVYTNWSDCKSQVDGYSGARFKSFATQAEAAAFASSGSSGSSRSGGYSGGYSGGGSTYSSSRNYSSSSSSSSGSSSSSRSGGYSGKSSYSGDRGYSGGSSSKSHSRNGISDSDYSGSYRHNSSSTRDGTSRNGSSQVVYTDGSALRNGRSGAKAGWGVYWGEGDSRNASGKVASGEMTNNRGELSAIRHAVESISKEAKPGSKYEIRADSQYARDCLGKWGNNWETNGWKTSTGGEVKNKDLIHNTRGSIENLRAKGVEVSISYVPGHAGHEGNEAADRLARKGATS